MLFVFLDICGGAKLISNGLSERNVNFIDNPNNVAIDFSREDLFQSTTFKAYLGSYFDRKSTFTLIK